jgi:uncharacterized protein YdhG (YjbR/CyaY superfamily)
MKNRNNSAQKSSRRATAGGMSEGFTDEERAAMRERAEELKATTRRGSGADKADGKNDMLAKIAEMQQSDRAMAERVHAIIKACAPALSARTWYGMPAYGRDGNVVCSFQSFILKRPLQDERARRENVGGCRAWGLSPMIQPLRRLCTHDAVLPGGFQ